MIVQKILFRMDTNIKNAVKGIMPINGNWDQFIAAFEDVCADSNPNGRNKLNNNFRRTQNFPVSRPENRESTAFGSTKAVAPNSERRTGKACSTCQSTDPTHDWKICKNKKRRVNDIEQEEEV